MVEIRMAHLEDAVAIRSVMDSVLPLVRENDFVADDLEFISDHLVGPNGFGLVATSENQESIIAFLIARFPKNAPDNLGRDLGLTEHALEYVVHMESIAVMPVRQGEGIQRALICEAEPIAFRLGAKLALCTVAPTNDASLENFKRLGYQIMMCLDKYGGKKRFILGRSFCEEVIL